MGFLGDMLDDPGPDGLFATPEERARQRGVQRTKAELARREYPARAEPNDRRQRVQRRVLRPNAGRPLDSMFATSEARAQPRGAQQAAGELAYRECLAQAAANPKDAGPPPDDTTIRAVVGLPAGLLIVAVIAAYLAIHIRATYLPP